MFEYGFLVSNSSVSFIESVCLLSFESLFLLPFYHRMMSNSDRFGSTFPYGTRPRLGSIKNVEAR